MIVPKMSSGASFGEADLPGEVVDGPQDTARRARVAKAWSDEIVLSDVKNKRQREFLVETRVRLANNGEATHFTEGQFNYLRGVYERATDDETSERY